MSDKLPYLRWHPAKADSVSMRGDSLARLNEGTYAHIQEQATVENRVLDSYDMRVKA